MDINNTKVVAVELCTIVVAAIFIQWFKLTTITRLYPLFAIKFLKLNDPKLRGKFCRQLYGLTWHVLHFICALVATYQSNFWSAIINPFNERYMELMYNAESPIKSVRLLYMINFAYYTGDFFWIFMYEKRNKRVEKIIHHVATLICLLFAYLPLAQLPLWKLGAAILLVHEMTDSVMYFQQTLYYVPFIGNCIPNAILMMGIMFYVIFRFIYSLKWYIFGFYRMSQLQSLGFIPYSAQLLVQLHFINVFCRMLFARTKFCKDKKIHIF
eukprot:315828_1